MQVDTVTAAQIHALNPWGYIFVVLLIAFIMFAVRSIIDSEPDPFLLSLTFFAFAGQFVRYIEITALNSAPWPLTVLLVLGIALLILQVFVFRKQISNTQKHYKDLLIGRRKPGVSDPPEVGEWAGVLVKITGVDYYPEFYLDYDIFGKPREKRREEALLVLNRDAFDTSGLKTEDLTVPPEKRRGLWRAYFTICLLSWVILTASVFITS